MTDERDPKLAKHYRELEPIEPPPELDQKILAAAREAADSPHAPLVAPIGRHRWYYSLAAAAVLVFAVALTLHLDRERPDPEAVPSASVRGEIKQAPQADTAARVQPERTPAFTPDPQASAPRAVAPPQRAPAPTPRTDELRRAQQAERMRAEQSASTAAANQAQAETDARGAREMAATAKQQQAVAARAPAAGAPYFAPESGLAQMRVAPENPERWLERIAELRSRGRHADADRELANFRKAYPDYRLSEMMRERVEGTTTSR